jgi:hypothetical protein
MLSGMSLLGGNNDDHESVRLCYWSACRPGFGFLKFCGGEIDLVGCGIYAHRSCSVWGFDGLDDFEFSWRCFTGYGEGAIAAAGESLTAVYLGGINASPDG